MSRSSSAIIFWQNKILLFHRDNKDSIPNPDCWSLPGGVIEKGETALEGLKRELEEEVSYVPRNITFLKKIQKSNIYISVVNDNEAARFKHMPGEGQEIRFFTIDEALTLKLAPLLRKYLTLYKDQVKTLIS